MGGVWRYFSEVPGSGVDLILPMCYETHRRGQKVGVAQNRSKVSRFGEHQAPKPQQLREIKMPRSDKLGAVWGDLFMGHSAQPCARAQALC